MMNPLQALSRRARPVRRPSTVSLRIEALEERAVPASLIAGPTSNSSNEVNYQGEVGVVIAQNVTKRLLPRVMVIRDGQGNEMAPHKIIDLSREPKAKKDEPYRILRSLEYDTVKIDPRELFL